MELFSIRIQRTFQLVSTRDAFANSQKTIPEYTYKIYELFQKDNRDSQR